MTEEVFDPIRTLLRRWKWLALAAVMGAALGTTYGFVAPAWYAATLTVVPSQRGQDSANLGGLAAKLPGALDAAGADVQRIEAVLNSNSVADAVIEHFDLKKKYGTEHIEQARALLREHCVTSVNRRSSVVTLICEDQTPKVAMEIAAYFGEVGNKVFGRVSVSSAREERAFLEQQVVIARKDVEEASAKLRAFQVEHKVIDLPEQTRAVITAMAQLQGEMLSKQVELSYLSGFSARSESNVMQLQQQLSILEAKLKQLEASAPPEAKAQGSAASKEEFFPGALSVPELRYELEQLMREQRAKETVFALMTQRLEMVRIDEARDTSTFQILDHPTLPTLRARPQRKKSIALGLGVGLAIGALGVLGPAWWRRRSQSIAAT